MTRILVTVAARALTEDGHQGREYWLTGPEALTAPEKVAVLSKVLDREIRFEELTTDQMSPSCSRSAPPPDPGADGAADGGRGDRAARPHVRRLGTRARRGLHSLTSLCSLLCRMAMRCA